MESKGFRRKLSAILSAYIASSIRLMQDDKAAVVGNMNQRSGVIERK